MPKTKLALTIPAALLFITQSVFAETHVVTAIGMKFEPMVVKIAPGDTVRWENMPTHNVETIEGLVPEGTEKIMSPMGENYQHTFDKEGIYVYICTPHIGSGMGGAVIVGEPTNLDDIKASDASGGLGRVVRKAIQEAEAM
ncbi:MULTISPECIES: plastocyanin/azurin family copper-binding protein [unclassified Methylophaga]|jgi:pseudoazurin|uniref:plastocyanin/azurin family copper-binding protein n=1 Tax=unclassified Methylophaga TaxID=2629249 RepID=UPI000C95D05B|nr:MULTISPECIES: plastocyanin/azurin family copper-binding protein [unclassified Methylophaga]MAK68112.1 copper-binding protein [Methylophaga sp.]MAY17867.1 copper-binding protein [Methylophaga sp.]MBN46927.1 copper-binding protein [Methylophaga sp.]HAO25798.1 copper-binding protein [Methylophaga sp.]HCD03961.1 copper-binding protein [Methylophaga sp.]|tara:strand:- start:25327 stop:25749 length:423 start_codon:yes stop_codon:yes gene_type:complete